MNTPGQITSILVVESQNDKAFIELLLRDLGVEEVEVEHLHKSIVDESGKELRGKDAIQSKIKNVQRELKKKYSRVEKIGVILDFDYPPKGLEENLNLVNKSFEGAFASTSSPFLKEGEMVEIEKGLSAACFFVKDSSGTGNLETLLLQIRKDPSAKVPYADCLELWRDCVNSPESISKLQVSSNTYAKVWLGYFLRAKAKELGKEGNKILKDIEDRLSEVITKVGASVFDLEHTTLKPLRDFLLLFKSTSPTT